MIPGMLADTRLRQTAGKLMAQIEEAEILQRRPLFKSPPRAIDPL